MCDPEHAAWPAYASVSQFRDEDLEVTGLNRQLGRVACRATDEVNLKGKEEHLAWEQHVQRPQLSKGELEGVLRLG